MSRPPRREAVAGPRGGKAIDQWRAPPTAQAGCPAYGEPIGAKKFLFPPFLRNLYVPGPDRSRPDTPQERCSETMQRRQQTYRET